MVRPPARRDCRARTSRETQQQTEQAVIKPQIKTKEKESQQRQRRAHPAKLMHRVINPVTRARIPENPGTVRQQKSLPRLRSLKIGGAIHLKDLPPVAPAEAPRSAERMPPTRKRKVREAEKSEPAAATRDPPTTRRWNEFAALARITKSLSFRAGFPARNPC